MNTRIPYWRSQRNYILAGNHAQLDQLISEFAALERRVNFLSRSLTAAHNRYRSLLEDVEGALGCTDGDDIRANLSHLPLEID